MLLGLPAAGGGELVKNLAEGSELTIYVQSPDAVAVRKTREAAKRSSESRQAEKVSRTAI